MHCIEQLISLNRFSWNFVKFDKMKYYFWEFKNMQELALDNISAILNQV